PASREWTAEDTLAASDGFEPWDLERDGFSLGNLIGAKGGGTSELTDLDYASALDDHPDLPPSQVVYDQYFDAAPHERLLVAGPGQAQLGAEHAIARLAFMRELRLEIPPGSGDSAPRFRRIQGGQRCIRHLVHV